MSTCQPILNVILNYSVTLHPFFTSGTRSTQTISGILLNRGTTSVFPSPADSTRCRFPSSESKTPQPPLKPSHIRRINTADSRQNNLTTVEMTGKYTVNVPFFQPVISQPGDWEMAEQDFVTVGVLKIPLKTYTLLDQLHRFRGICPGDNSHKCRQSGGAGINGDVLVLVIQDIGTGRFV